MGQPVPPEPEYWKGSDRIIRHRAPTAAWHRRAAATLSVTVVLIAAVWTLLPTPAIAAPRFDAAPSLPSYCRNPRAAINHPDCVTPSPSVSSTVSPSPGPSSSPSPTATSPSPSPTGVINCMPTPHDCGWPDATNTGVPGVVILTIFNGDLIMNTPGQTYAGLDIKGCAFAAADNVTLQNSIVRDDCWRSGRSSTYLIDNDDKPWHVAIHDVTVNGSAIPTNGAHNRLNMKGVSGSNLTISRVRWIGMADCVHYSSNVLVEDSFCELPLIPLDIAPYDPHVDGFQSAGGSDVVLWHNTIRNANNQTSAIINGTTPGISPPQFNVRMLNNLMAGGGWTVYANAHYASVSPTIEFRGNRIAKQYYTWPISPSHPYDRGGYWGPFTGMVGLPGAETTVWDEDNSLIPVQ